jgi:hypothetical protein
MVASLTTGAPTDLLSQISSTPTARGGYYSPYIGAVVDVVRILGTTHSAQYQYIPALALPKKDALNLRLNNPPSFRNPKSVIVIALPPVRAAVAPPLRALEVNQTFCANKPDLVLPVDGAPLVFATELAHNFVLHLETKAGATDLPAKPDPSRGGFVIDTETAGAHGWHGELLGTIRGTWGFHAFEGPHFRLRASQPAQWVVASKDASALIVGREDILHLQSGETCCVSEVLVRDESGKTTPLEWKAAKAEKPEELEVKVPLQNAASGPLKLAVKKFGQRDPDEIILHTYYEAGRLDSFSIDAGDLDGILRGTRLDQVAKIDVNGIVFEPGNVSRANQHDELKLSTTDSAATKLLAGAAIVVHASLKDGRTLELNSTVAAPRPKLNLLSKSVQFSDSDSQPLIKLGNADELPQDARLNFFLKTQVPESFAAGERVEVATADESFHVLLSVKDGNLTLQDAKTVYAVFDPMKLLGPSAFGPLKFRAVGAEGAEGDWQPLVNLVRIPELKGIRCAAASNAAEKAAADEKVPAEKSPDCTLSGDKLFLIDAVSADPDFTNAVTVPDGFIDAALTVPSPKNKTLYIKLRDDPGTVNTAVLPVLVSQP